MRGGGPCCTLLRGRAIISGVVVRFKLSPGRSARVMGNRIPIGEGSNRDPVGYGNGMVIVSKKFSETCRGRAKVTKCALICGSCKLLLMTRRPFRSARTTVGGRGSVRSRAMMIAEIGREHLINSASTKEGLGRRVGSLR